MVKRLGRVIYWVCVGLAAALAMLAFLVLCVVTLFGSAAAWNFALAFWIGTLLIPAAISYWVGRAALYILADE